MAYPKADVLAHAAEQLNRPDQPWFVTVQGDSIIAQWKWMDAQWFAPGSATNEVQSFSFTATLDDNGKYKEVDRSQAASGGMSMSGGTLSFGTSSSSFKGHQVGKSFQFGVGHDNNTGQTGFIAAQFDTERVKQPVRAYLEACGYKKAGLFG